MTTQDWFEMSDIRRKCFGKCVWIPLRAVESQYIGKQGCKGYQNEFFGSGSIAVPTKNIKSAKKIDWNDLGISHWHGGYFDNDILHTS